MLHKYFVISYQIGSYLLFERLFFRSTRFSLCTTYRICRAVPGGLAAQFDPWFQPLWDVCSLQLLLIHSTLLKTQKREWLVLRLDLYISAWTTQRGATANIFSIGGAWVLLRHNMEVETRVWTTTYSQQQWEIWSLWSWLFSLIDCTHSNNVKTTSTIEELSKRSHTPGIANQSSNN